MASLMAHAAEDGAEGAYFPLDVLSHAESATWLCSGTPRRPSRRGTKRCPT